MNFRIIEASFFLVIYSILIKNVYNSEDNVNFPSLLAHLNDEKNYQISSSWEFSDSRSIQLVEYFLFENDIHEGNKGFNFARLDVKEKRLGNDEAKGYRLYVSYLTRTMVKADVKDCNVINRPDDWIDTLSIKFQDEQTNASSYYQELAHKHYGVGGLWTFASFSKSIKFLGRFKQPEEEHFIWLLSKDDRLKGASLKFDFACLRYEKTDSTCKKFRLDSIDIELAKNSPLNSVRKIHIDSLYVKVGSTNQVHFILPGTCEFAIEADYMHQLPDFPIIDNEFDEGSTKTSLKLMYELHSTLDRTRIVSKLTEILNADKTGFITIESSNYTIVLWLLKNDGTLIENPSIKRCRNSRNAGDFFSLSKYAGCLGEGIDGVDERWSNSLIGHLWSVMGIRSKLRGGNIIASTLIHIYKDGKNIRQMEYSYSGHHCSITFTFEHSPTDNKLNLHSIYMSGHQDLAIDVKFSFQSVETTELKPTDLPVECAENLDMLEFPRLSTLYNDSDIIHIQSEVLINKITQTGDIEPLKYLILDEWLQSGRAFRSQAREASKLNCDILMYSQTKEFFNLTNKFECLTQPNVFKNFKLGFDDEDWFSDNLFVSGNIFYGPLSLWLLAQRPIVRLERMTEDLNVLGVVNLDTLNQWFFEERWMIRHPTKTSLKFIMKFRFDKVKGVHSVILETIQSDCWMNCLLEDKSRPDQITSTVNNINLIPFSKNHTASLLETFSIPVGHGCRRKRASYQKAQDLIVHTVLSPIQFEYHATLSLADPQGSQTLEPQPVVVSGWFAQCPDMWNLVPFKALRVNNQRYRYSNGLVKSQTIMSTKESVGVLGIQMRSLDEMSGVCSIRRTSRKFNEITELDFTTERSNQSLRINITNEILYHSLVESLNIIQINELNDNNHNTEVVYETRKNLFTLNDRLAGPASIVRTYIRTPEVAKFGDVYQHHSSKIDIIMPGKAHLTVSIKDLRFTECSAVLQKAMTEDCFEPTESLSSAYALPSRIRGLKLTFMPEGGILTSTEFESDLLGLEMRFLESMLSLPLNLEPMQLGRIHLSFNKKESSIQVRFNLMEPAPPVNRYVHLMKKDIDTKPSLVSSRYVESKYICSSLCEQSNCAAFSFCKSRVCQIIEEASWNSDQSGTTKDLASWLESRLKQDNSCDSYYKEVGNFGAPLKIAIDWLKDEILTINQTLILKAKRLTNDLKYTLVSIEEEQDRILNDFDPDTTKANFILIRSSAKLNLETISNLDKVRFKLLNVKDLNECFKVCSSGQCNLISFCKKDNVCLTIGDVSNLQKYRQILDNIQISYDCSMFSEDPTKNYEKFHRTSKPTEYISVTFGESLFDCATMCNFEQDTKHEANDCLSFNYCIEETGSSCYLQKYHISMQSFDGSILNNEEGTNSTSLSNLNCFYYSKSLVSDYSIEEHKKFVEQKSIMFKTELETCALICRRTLNCIAFEYCWQSQENKRGTCRMEKADSKIEKSTIDQLKLDKSTNCNVYKLKLMDEDGDITSNKTEEIMKNWKIGPGKSNELHFKTIILSSVVSIIVGLIASILYIQFCRLTSKLMT